MKVNELKSSCSFVVFFFNQKLSFSSCIARERARFYFVLQCGEQTPQHNKKLLEELKITCKHNVSA